MMNWRIYLEVKSMSSNIQMCTKCVMDTTDPEITFDDKGVCSHCNKFSFEVKKKWFPNERGHELLFKEVEKIKALGKNKEYDCILGLSGGADSSYLAVKIKEYGLRPLVVHVDAGWNSELAVYNIEQVVKYCGYDLHTHVMNWEEIRDLQLSLLKAGLANQDVVQDHAFFSSLYHFATKNSIKYVISGGNFATESIFPQSWQHSAMDSISLKDIHKTYGTKKITDFKMMSIFQYYIYFPYLYKMKVLRPLNFMDYNKERAIKFLQDEVGFKPYDRKHGESIFTKFFQNYYQPLKFGYDKRKPHLSSLIVSGQMTREEALNELKKPLYGEEELKRDIEYVAKKLRISKQELEELTRSPGRKYTEFKNWDKTYNYLKSVQFLVEKVLNKKIGNYN